MSGPRKRPARYAGITADHAFSRVSDPLPATATLRINRQLASGKLDEVKLTEGALVNLIADASKALDVIYNRNASRPI